MNDERFQFLFSLVDGRTSTAVLSRGRDAQTIQSNRPLTTPDGADIVACYEQAPLLIEAIRERDRRIGELQKAIKDALRVLEQSP